MPADHRRNAQSLARDLLASKYLSEVETRAATRSQAMLHVSTAVHHLRLARRSDPDLPGLETAVSRAREAADARLRKDLRQLQQELETDVEDDEQEALDA